jgi:hypothetical protein
MLGGEPVKIGCFELVASITAEEVSIKGVEKNDAGIFYWSLLSGHRFSLGSMIWTATSCGIFFFAAFKTT